MTKRAGMLIAIFGAAALVSCSTFRGDPGDAMDGLREQVEASVLDIDRAQSILASVDRIDGLFTESSNILVQAQNAERLLFLNYDSTREEYWALINSERIARREIQEQVLALHLSIKSQVTAEEWRELRPVMIDVVASRVEAMMSKYN